MNEERLKNICRNFLTKLKMLVHEIETAELTNEQWYINFEDEINKLSVKDHNASQNS